MKKKVTIAALAALLVAVLLAAVILGGHSESAAEPEQTAMETVATTEVNIPGLEDSIFDDEPEQTEETTPETQETTVNTEPTETTKATEPTKPTEHPKDPNPIDPSKPTNPKPTRPTEPTKPTEPSKPSEPTDSTEPSGGETVVKNYAWFQNLSPSEQQAWMDSFATIDAFFEWYNAAKAEYEKANPSIEFNGESIDMGAIIEGKE